RTLAGAPRRGRERCQERGDGESDHGAHSSAYDERATPVNDPSSRCSGEPYLEEDSFRLTAARMRVTKAFSSISSPSCKSIARRVLPSRLELNSPEGSSSEAPLKNVSFTTLLYVSPVQIPPSCDQTGTPGFVAFRHFHSSTTWGSACLIRARILARVSPRQSPSSSILASISWEGDSEDRAGFFSIGAA